MLEFLSKIHLYRTKQEALTKAILITISWRGGVKLIENADVISNTLAISFFLFSISLIMEYSYNLFKKDTLWEMIIPALMVIPSLFAFIVATSVLLNNPFNNLGASLVYKIMLVTQYILWIDVFVQFFVTSKPANMENKLKDIQVK